ncbi:5-oxoprolinase-like [Clavelina lepadiformis]|uniref:5-oxoprolinase-like n=1 Tax=Clavelina lepadiformis TaxID=159417 RepID=UPI0040429895
MEGKAEAYWQGIGRHPILYIFTQERLDFLCTLFGPDGRLVSNASHIPSHLEAMLDGVQYQMWAIEINERNCIVSNHPCAGGVHLPVYSQVTAFLTLPGEFTSCSRAHDLHGNLADLRALVAANQKGIHLVQELISRSATFDFEGTSPMVINKLNAPRAISKSVIIYCLRCMVGYDIPLNQGCLAPIPVNKLKWSILDPKDDAAVVGGNVLTSQRIVDIIMKAFIACAVAQGCMNNTTFGDESFGYYDTVAGGAEAGPTWHGRSGFHNHMTNTRSTDPERYV